MKSGLPIDWLGEILDPFAFLQTLDIFVLISEPAGCPNAGLEAMSVGLPIIATDFGGASEQVGHCLNGLLVPRGDVQALAVAIAELSASHSMREMYGAASHRRVRTQFSLARMMQEYRRVFGL